ncbi:MAG TPA: hypothetical protein VEB39_09820 [Sphingomicrobium sp.]|nr:hypothetical protein [Sphingomicrobium sp.]
MNGGGARRKLLDAAGSARSKGGAADKPEAKGGFFSRLGLTRKSSASMPFEEQLKIVEAAGRWFVFWGERGHAIRAWF